METRQRVSEIFKTGLSEIKHKSAKQYALFGATVLGIVFEWSPANEAMLGAVGVNIHEQLGTGASMSESLADRLFTGIATGSVSFTQQLLVGSLTALSVSKFPKTFESWQNSRPKDANQELSTTSSSITALALGSSMAVLENKLTKNDVSTKESLILAAKTSAVVGVFNTALVGVVSGALEALDRNGRQNLSEDIANTLKNPLLYLGVFGLAKAVQIIKSKNTNDKDKK